MKTEKIEIGCNVYGIDVNALSSSDIQELKDVLYKNRLVVIKNQTITDQEYVNFANQFGHPVPYLQANYHHPEFPLIFVSSNIKQNGKQVGVARTGGYWHSDTAFEEEPKILTMLLPKVLPPAPRTTRFIDMAEVYKALPSEIIEKIQDEKFVHSGRWKYKVRKEDAGLDISEILEMIDYLQPPVTHPAVIVHPYTKEKIIYGTSGFTIGIQNKTIDESNRILKQIFDFSESGQFTKEVKWALGDLIIWDNRFLAHSSGRKKAPSENIHEEVTKEEETMMYRITLFDDYQLCATLEKLEEATA